MEDVWITQTPGVLPWWLEDINVREGIRAMLKVTHCREERVRVGAEADNLCCWFGQELSSVKAALALPSSTYSTLIQFLQFTDYWETLISGFYYYNIEHI